MFGSGGKRAKKNLDNSDISPRQIAQQEIVLDKVFSLFGSVVNQNEPGLESRRRSNSSTKSRPGKGRGTMSRSESVPAPKQTR